MVEHSPQIFAGEEKPTQTRTRAHWHAYIFCLLNAEVDLCSSSKPVPLHEDCHTLCLKTTIHRFFFSISKIWVSVHPQCIERESPSLKSMAAWAPTTFSKWSSEKFSFENHGCQPWCQNWVVVLFFFWLCTVKFKETSSTKKQHTLNFKMIYLYVLDVCV